MAVENSALPYSRPFALEVGLSEKLLVELIEQCRNGVVTSIDGRVLGHFA